jgi:DNA-binding NtrC family response regulator
MTPVLRALIVEDSEIDSELLCLALRKFGFDVHARRVDTEEEMSRALSESEWDIVFSDYSMPTFSAPRALKVLKRSHPELPFVIVSGTIGEEVAVEAMRSGAQDFLVKGRLARLQPVVARELQEARERKERRAAERALRESEVQYRRIVETAQEGIWTLDENDRTSYANHRLAELLGAPLPSLSGSSFLDFMDPEQKGAGIEFLERRHAG